MKCIFCTQLEIEVPPVFETNKFVARLDIHPVSPGHMLIIPKRHIACLQEFTNAELLGLPAMWDMTHQYLRAGRRETLRKMYESLRGSRLSENSPWFIRQALEHPRFGTMPDAFNHVVNEGKAAGQTVSHLHWHMIPRYTGDVKDPSGGGRYVIPKMGNYHEPRDIGGKLMDYAIELLDQEGT